MRNEDDASKADQTGATNTNPVLILSNGDRPMPKTAKRYDRASSRSTAASASEMTHRVSQLVAKQRAAFTGEGTAGNLRSGAAANSAIDALGACCTRKRWTADELPALLAVAMAVLEWAPKDLKRLRRKGFMDQRIIATVFDEVRRLAA